MSPAVIEPAAGPADPPSSRQGAGVLGGQVLAFRYAPAAGVQRIPVPGLHDVAVTPDTVVHWAFYADGPGAVQPPHAALAVTIDVEFDDGSRLTADARVRDRYGFAMGAAEQFDAAWSMPEQWNADTVSLEPWAGRTARIVAVLGAADLDGPEVDGFLEVVVGTRPDTAGLTPAERVDTRRGSHAGPRFSRGNTIPIVAAPHGFCFLTPATDADDSRWPYRWSVHDDAEGRPLSALQFSHQPSPWIGDRGVVQLRPIVGSDRTAAPRIVPGSEYARPFGYDAELRGGARVRMTGTSHAGAFEATAASASDPVGFTLRVPGEGGRLTSHGDGSFDGWAPEGSADWGNPPRTYFAGRVVAGTLDGEEIRGAGRAEVRIAQSFLSVDQARRALAEEMPDDSSVDDLREALRGEWDALLGAVTVPEPDIAERPWRGLADDDARAQIASALYRIHLYPNTMAENVGTRSSPRLRFADPMVPSEPHGDDRSGAPVAVGELYVNNGYWDTYRTAWPALVLLQPERAGRMLDGLLEQWRRGGWMARWSAPGYVDSMVGTSSDQIFADAERWGADFDLAAAFESAWRNACEPGRDARHGRKGVDRARFTGYVASETPEGMSWSLENAMSDGAIARLAERLARRGGARAPRYDAHARYFRNRARSYRVLFDADHGFFRGRDSAGRFSSAEFDPRVWGGDNVETNAWGMSLAAVHDGAGLAELHGGPHGLRAHLDRLFAEPETGDEAFAGSYGAVIHEQREARALRSGMCAISNQPAHHIPWMHVHGDQPWRAGETVHALAGRLFSGAMIGQGYPGDEDNGEMSAWWLWAALGLYPLELASGELRIGSPLFDDITVWRSGAGSLRIRSRRSSAHARFLVSASLNGAQLERAVLDVDLLAASGGEQRDIVLDLEFGDDETAAAESPIWRDGDARAPLEPWHPDLTGRTGWALDAAHTSLFDDDGTALGAISLAPGASAGWVFDAQRSVTDVTVTTATDAGAGALQWQASEDGETWHDVTTTHRESLRADRTTPFAFATPVRARMLRVRASETVALRQLELFDLDGAAGEP